jgi:hypothetical protein
MLSPGRWPIGCAVTLSLFLAHGFARVAAQDVSLSDVLQLSASYLEDFDTKFSAVISQESYKQTETRLEGQPAQPRTYNRQVKSQILFVNGGGGTWLCFRDVFEVDGKGLPDHVERFARLLASSPVDSVGAGSLASQIASESARYNLGGVARNFNVPTMALTFLRRANQERSKFHDDGVQRKGQSTETHVVSFSEKRRPTLVRDAADHDVPATGRFWIEASGRIDRTELLLETEAGVRATVTVEYGPQPKLDVFVPLSMHEQYEQSIVDKIDAHAEYSGFVVPNVTVDLSGFKDGAGRTGRGRGGV